MEQEKNEQEEKDVLESIPQLPQTNEAAAYEMEHDDDDNFNVSLASIINGELLGGAWMRRQVAFMLLLLLLAVLYITNRYSAEQELIKIADSKRELQDIKYRSLTRSSELTMRTRQSLIEDALRRDGDTTLTASTIPPFVIQPRHDND